MTLRVGIVGAGYWGRNLIRTFGALPGVEIRVVADADPAARSGVEGTWRTSAEPAAAWEAADVDAVVVATPPATHFELARAALEAGKHCWVEKPLALGARDAECLVELADRHDRTLFVDETFLYDPLVRTARGWIADGRLGRVCHLSFERLGMGRIRRDSDVWWNSAPHDLAILLFLVPGEVQRVDLRRFSYLQAGLADFCVATVELEGGASAHVYLSWLSPTKAASVTVVGDRGMLHYEGRFQQRRLSFYDYAVRDPRTVPTNVVPIDRFEATETVPGGSEEPLRLAAEAFVSAVASGEPPPSCGRNSLLVVRLLEAGDRSASPSGGQNG